MQKIIETSDIYRTFWVVHNGYFRFKDCLSFVQSCFKILHHEMREGVVRMLPNSISITAVCRCLEGVVSLGVRTGVGVFIVYLVLQRHTSTTASRM